MATVKKALAKKAVISKTATKKIIAKKAPLKKEVTKKTTSATKTDALSWSVIHIYGYGETQIIGAEYNGKVANDDLKALQPLIAALAEKQQKGTKINLGNTHALNIFNGAYISFLPAPDAKSKPQRFLWSDVNLKQIDSLVKELINQIPEKKIMRRASRLPLRK